MLQYERKLQLNPRAISKTFTIGFRFYDLDLRVYDGVIVLAGESASSGIHDLFNGEPNWTKATEVLFQFYKLKHDAFCEILTMLDKNAEEHKELQCAVETFIHSKISEFQQEIQNYESLLKRF